MIFANKYTKILIDSFSGFGKCSYLLDAYGIHGADEGGINSHAVFSALTDYVTEVLAKNVELSDEEIKIYKFVDNCRTSYANSSEDTLEGDFDNAICTCFLENLINRDSSGNYDFNRILPYLNEKSKEYCKAWDKFTGVRSPGLWADQEWDEVNQT